MVQGSAEHRVGWGFLIFLAEDFAAMGWGREACTESVPDPSSHSTERSFTPPPSAKDLADVATRRSKHESKRTWQNQKWRAVGTGRLAHLLALAH